MSQENPNKTVKVDEAVHSKLENKKREYRVDTFNEVLRRELGITPGPTVEELGAYLTEEQRDAARDILETIEGVGNIKKRVDSSGYNDFLNFVSEENGELVGRIEFSEDTLRVKYRDSNGEMGDSGIVSEQDGESRYGEFSSTYDAVQLEEILEAIEKNLSGAYRRWGTE